MMKIKEIRKLTPTTAYEGQVLGKHSLSMGIVSSRVSCEHGKSLDNHNCKQRGTHSKVEKIQVQQKGTNT